MSAGPGEEQISLGGGREPQTTIGSNVLQRTAAAAAAPPASAATTTATAV